MAPIRVLVVEDSLTIRRRIVEIFESAPEFEVVGEAADGGAAVELCAQLRPDVVTLDMMLPVMSGLEATERIMSACPTPILIVSASTNRGELFRTYDALAAGAVDVLEKPLGTTPDVEWVRALLRAARIVSRVQVITRMRPQAALARGAPARTTSPMAPGPEHSRRAIVVGASTGGPGAVRTLLRSLPSSCSLPILLVMHIAEPFGSALAEWLTQQTGLPVRFAEHGEPLASQNPRSVRMAPPGRHLELRAGSLRLSDDAEVHCCRPSVDVLFESAARELGPAAIGCLLTGMGRDGARGLLSIRRAGGFTIAQDEATSVVYGMPGEAARLGAAIAVMPLPEIGTAIARAARTRGSRQ